MTSRRKFLKFAGAAPVAIPVAAKEAAVKMGLGSAPTLTMLGNYNAGYPISAAIDAPSSELDYLCDQLKQTVEDKQDIFRETKRDLIRMDADLAALRSVSPSWVGMRLVEREAARRIESRTSWLEKRIKKLSGGLL